MSIRRPTLSRLAAERQADELLRHQSEAPWTDSQLKRRSRREIPAGLSPADEEAEGASAYEELVQLARLSPLTPPQLLAFRLWAAGHTVTEAAWHMGVSRATAARIIRSALVTAYLMGGPTFRQFSARRTYRKSPDEDACRSGARCEVCAAPLWDDYERVTCGAPHCEEILEQQKELDRRRLLHRLKQRGA